MGAYLGHLWSEMKGSESFFFFLLCTFVKVKLLWLNGTHFTLNLELLHMQSFSSKLFMVSRWGSQQHAKAGCLRDEQNAERSTFFFFFYTSGYMMKTDEAWFESTKKSWYASQETPQLGILLNWWTGAQILRLAAWTTWWVVAGLVE